MEVNPETTCFYRPGLGIRLTLSLRDKTFEDPEEGKRASADEEGSEDAFHPFIGTYRGDIPYIRLVPAHNAINSENY